MNRAALEAQKLQESGVDWFPGRWVGVSCEEYEKRILQFPNIGVLTQTFCTLGMFCVLGNGKWPRLATLVSHENGEPTSCSHAECFVVVFAGSSTEKEKMK